MAERVWDKFLTDLDKQHLADRARRPVGYGERLSRVIEELLLVRGVTPELFWGKYVVKDDGSVERKLGVATRAEVVALLTADTATGAPA